MPEPEMSTVGELREHLREHRKYDKWWNSLTLEEKNAIHWQMKVMLKEPTEVQAPLVDVIPMESGPSFGAKDEA